MTTDPAISAPTSAPPPKLSGRGCAALWSAAALGAGLLSLGVLYVVDPARHQIYPTCLFYATTGWECPGCGGLRATHQLLHGHLAAAWAYNPLAVLLAPLGAGVGADLVLRLTRGRGLLRGAPRPAVIWFALAGLVAFTILRNLPWH